MILTADQSLSPVVHDFFQDSRVAATQPESAKWHWVNEIGMSHIDHQTLAAGPAGAKHFLEMQSIVNRLATWGGHHFGGGGHERERHTQASQGRLAEREERGEAKQEGGWSRRNQTSHISWHAH